MGTWKRIAAIVVAMVLGAGTTAYAQSDKGKGNGQGQLKQLVILSASADRANDHVVLRGQNFGTSAPMVYCETHPLTVLQYNDQEVVVWFPGSVPQGTYLFNMVRGRGNSELDRNTFYVTVP